MSSSDRARAKRKSRKAANRKVRRSTKNSTVAHDSMRAGKRSYGCGLGKV